MDLELDLRGRMGRAITDPAHLLGGREEVQTNRQNKDFRRVGKSNKIDLRVVQKQGSKCFKRLVE